jgi:threonine dehydrogenase-like Zn-dependent dehydrogenase
MEHSDSGRRMGHEAIGIVEAVGADVRTLKVGDVVVMPFAYSGHLPLLSRGSSDVVHPRRVLRHR